MRNMVHFNRRITIKYRYIIIFSLIIGVGLWLKLFSTSLHSKALTYAKNEVEYSTNSVISNCINNMAENSIDNDVITFTKNNNNEIILAEYKLSRLYGWLKSVTEDLYRVLNKKSQLLIMPLGMVSDNIFLNNLGPKIPIGISWIQNVFTNLKF